ncbi:hypothetical protein [uncultured Thiodictyon sp.]|jgi:hypothetical protein|uniref:hypothetical protein n=1 Tax=uncultured Thiodictyon sp. TaxID=1846217 RepID=UPI0025D6BD51|nr:hypothetical protein [uncultured Thiodictyon sp.]
MKTRIEDVALLEGYDARAFRDWLTRGFRDYRHPKGISQAFAPLNACVGREQDPTLELRVVHELLSGTAQGQLRAGLALAVQDLNFRAANLGLMKELFHFAGRIKATEVLDAALTQIGTGPFGRPDRPETADLFAFMLGIVAGMAPGTGVADTLRHLVGSPPFASDYAPLVFVGLCRAEPARFPEHLAFLRGHFEVLHAAVGTSGAELTARRFAWYVPLDLIAGHLYRLAYSLDDKREPWRLDNWLINALFTGVSPSLRLLPRADGGEFEPNRIYDDFWIARLGGESPLGVQVVRPTVRSDSDRRLDQVCSRYLNRLAKPKSGGQVSTVGLPERGGPEFLFRTEVSVNSSGNMWGFFCAKEEPQALDELVSLLQSPRPISVSTRR